jgi:hypothetical protein
MTDIKRTLNQHQNAKSRSMLVPGLLLQRGLGGPRVNLFNVRFVLLLAVA